MHSLPNIFGPQAVPLSSPNASNQEITKYVQTELQNQNLRLEHVVKLEFRDDKIHGEYARVFARKNHDEPNPEGTAFDILASLEKVSAALGMTQFTQVYFDGDKIEIAVNPHRTRTTNKKFNLPLPGGRVAATHILTPSLNKGIDGYVCTMMVLGTCEEAKERIERTKGTNQTLASTMPAP